MKLILTYFIIKMRKRKRRQSLVSTRRQFVHKNETKMESSNTEDDIKTMNRLFADMHFEKNLKIYKNNKSLEPPITYFIIGLPKIDATTIMFPTYWPQNEFLTSMLIS